VVFRGRCGGWGHSGLVKKQKVALKNLKKIDFELNCFKVSIINQQFLFCLNPICLAFKDVIFNFSQKNKNFKKMSQKNIFKNI
jgi:hypothetical protein